MIYLLILFFGFIVFVFFQYKKPIKKFTDNSISSLNNLTYDTYYKIRKIFPKDCSKYSGTASIAWGSRDLGKCKALGCEVKNTKTINPGGDIDPETGHILCFDCSGYSFDCVNPE